MSPINDSTRTEPGISEVIGLIDANKYDLRGAVKLPDREDRNEWIAKNLFDFHKQVCKLYGTVSEFCTRDKCPEMTAGLRKYEWASRSDMKELRDLSAADYIYRSLDWVQEQLDDENIFPTMSVDKDFPQNFGLVARTIAKRLFRVFAHVYHHHLAHVRLAEIEAHMNTSLKHFIYFVDEFDLVTLEELSPLRDHIKWLGIPAIEGFDRLKIQN